LPGIHFHLVLVISGWVLVFDFICPIRQYATIVLNLTNPVVFIPVSRIYFVISGRIRVIPRIVRAAVILSIARDIVAILAIGACFVILTTGVTGHPIWN